MLAAEGKWVIIPVHQENRFFPCRKVTVSSVHLWGGERQWEDKWWKVPKISFGIDSNNPTRELGDGCAAWHIMGRGGWWLRPPALPVPVLGVSGDWCQHWGVSVTHPVHVLQLQPWHKQNCPEWRWVGDWFASSDPKDKPYVDIPGYSTYLSGEHSCGGWCSAAPRPDCGWETQPWEWRES